MIQIGDKVWTAHDIREKEVKKNHRCLKVCHVLTRENKHRLNRQQHEEIRRHYSSIGCWNIVLIDPISVETFAFECVVRRHFIA